LTATYIAAYIVDLILVLHEISMVTLAVATLDPPKSSSRDLVMDALATYKTKSSDIHAKVKEVAISVRVTLKLEEKIASVIRDALPHETPLTGRLAPVP
jgi:hypothetical protein